MTHALRSIMIIITLTTMITLAFTSATATEINCDLESTWSTKVGVQHCAIY